MKRPTASPSLSAQANVLLPGLYAWVSTVAFSATARGASLPARIAAGAALVVLIAAVLVSSTRPVLGRRAGVYGFVGLCALTWALLGEAIAIDRIDPVRAALGAVAWGLFAFGWGAVRRPGVVPEDDPRAEVGDVLRPRKRLPPRAVVLFIVSLVGGLVPVFLAWQVVRPRHAMLAHAAALACAIAMVTTGAAIAVERGKWSARPVPSERLASAALPLTALAVLAVLGLVRVLVG